MAPKITVSGIIGAENIVSDDWFFSNFYLYRQLAQHLEGDWMGCVDLVPNWRYLEYHGSPDAQRVIVNPNHDDFQWYKQYSPEALKTKALAMIRHRCRKAKRHDRLVFFVVGHGSSDIRTKGSVFMGQALLHPEDVFTSSAVIQCKASITFVVDSCYSGAWITKSTDVQFRSTVEVVCGADDQTEIISCGKSGSGRRRGGIFSNFIASAVYGEYNLNLPRPPVIGDGGEIEEVFPPQNIDAEYMPDRNPMRHYSTKLWRMVQKMSYDMLRLSATYPLRRHRTQGRLTEPVDGLTALGLAEGRGFQPTLHRLFPANPGREGDTEASTDPQVYGHIGM